MVLDLDVLLFYGFMSLFTILIFTSGILCLLKESIKKDENK
jgi:hypothetical protein